MSEPTNKDAEREAFKQWMAEKDAFAWRDEVPGVENDKVANPLFRALPGGEDIDANKNRQ